MKGRYDFVNSGAFLVNIWGLLTLKHNDSYVYANYILHINTTAPLQKKILGA